MPKKLPTLHAAARAVLAIWPEQPAPLQDLCEAMGVLAAVLDNDSKRRSKRTKGKAGAKASPGLLDKIDGLLGQGIKPPAIAEAVKCSQAYVRQRQAVLRGEATAGK